MALPSTTAVPAPQPPPRSLAQALVASHGQSATTYNAWGFYEFFFATESDLQIVWAMGTVNLKPGMLRLFEWSVDIDMHNQRNTHAQVWIRLMTLRHDVTNCRWLYPRKEDMSKDKVAKGKMQIPSMKPQWVHIKENPYGIGSSIAFATPKPTEP
ncbi:DUF4283 domain protein [Medicago truncatula]|uniref:DUF4283 domain protein n=1 Tax=Medicago truncatula TaxID=3880 RepID=G7IX18_MEDTR|nr:DUF4283 domain protein [Medicago truncatula]